MYVLRNSGKSFTGKHKHVKCGLQTDMSLLSLFSLEVDICLHCNCTKNLL